ncbi:MAG: thiamine diphosphokinase [Oscillospiraceae bacterium]|nr:thiamine diphosphokinase [Oscillospiraceae bacterium]
MKRCVIVAGGDYAPIAPLEAGDFILACDRGYVHTQREGLTPDLLMGDFDSYDGALPEDVPVERFPVEKDDTDTMLAIRWAAAHGFEAVRICCGFGGRFDHTLANIQSLHFAVRAGMEAAMDDERTTVRVLLPGEYRVPCHEGWTLSVFALTDRCENLRIHGTKYEAEGVTLTNAFPLGVSNAFRGDARLAFDSGVLCLVCARLEA